MAVLVRYKSLPVVPSTIVPVPLSVAPKRRPMYVAWPFPLYIALALGFTFKVSSFRSIMSSVSDPAFSLLVKLEFKEESFKDQFLKDMAPLAKYVKEEEPDTLAYEILFNDKDPLKVLVLERYKDKEIAFLKVHRSSLPFQEFRPKLKAMIDGGYVTMEGDSYIDSMLGFGDRAI
jgi:quinol monooxygenase YgiN